MNPSKTENATTTTSKTDLETIFSSMEIPKTESVSTGTNLTLQEKQRIIKQQETHQIFKQASPIAPTPAPVKQTIQPKNLTDTLLESNLNEMKWSNNLTSPTSGTSGRGFTPFQGSQPPPVMGQTFPANWRQPVMNSSTPFTGNCDF